MSELTLYSALNLSFKWGNATEPPEVDGGPGDDLPFVCNGLCKGVAALATSGPPLLAHAGVFSDTI